MKTSIDDLGDNTPEEKKPAPQLRDNLGHWLPGHSGNPEGRYMGGRGIFTDLLQQTLDACKPGSTKARKIAIVEKLCDEAEDGNIAAAKLLFAYCDGLPTVRIQQAITGTIASDPSWMSIRTVILQIAETNPELGERIRQLDDEHDDGFEDGS